MDVACLQALSRRVHFGKFVAEAKFLKEKAKFTKLIEERDIEGINREITDEKVELQVLERLRKKATSYGRDPALPDDQQEQGPLKVNVDAVVNLYKDWVRIKDLPYWRQFVFLRLTLLDNIDHTIDKRGGG